MKRRLNLLLRILALCLLFIVIFSFYKPSKEVTVVVAGDMTGKYAEIGNSVKFGVDFIVKSLGDLPKDFKIKVRALGDGGDTKQAEQVALDAVADPSVIAVIGHSSSGETAAAIKIYSAYGMPILRPVATNPDLTSNPCLTDKTRKLECA
jgi:branched-chain amino acid transport system substrate-binding protein